VKEEVRLPHESTAQSVIERQLQCISFSSMGSKKGMLVRKWHDAHAICPQRFTKFREEFPLKTD
jgi:hypothetical protein